MFASAMDHLIDGLIVSLPPYSPAGATSEDRLMLLYSVCAHGLLAATLCRRVVGHWVIAA